MKKVMRRVKTKVSKASKVAKRKIRRIAQPLLAKKEFPLAQETIIEQAKFYTHQVFSSRRTETEDLPSSYGRDKIVLQVRDPWWIYAYWEVRPDTIERFKDDLKDNFFKAKRVLRVYDVSHINFNGSNAHRFFDIHISDFANSWYIDTGGPGRSWCVDLGLLLSDGRFITIIRSNTVHTPLDGPSWITDEEWMIPEDLFARLYGLGIGFGSSPIKIKKLMQQRMKRDLSSGSLSSMSSPTRKPKGRNFWLVVNTELIVYGATEPDAKVTVQGKSIKLRADGTFSLRFALPDGKQVIPVRAEAADKKEKRTITPQVTRETR